MRYLHFDYDKVVLSMDRFDFSFGYDVSWGFRQCDNTYGTLTLIRSTSDISSEVSERLLANVSELPPRSSLIVSGKTVKLRCPRVGLVISFRL